MRYHILVQYAPQQKHKDWQLIVEAVDHNDAEQRWRRDYPPVAHPQYVAPEGLAISQLGDSIWVPLALPERTT